MNSMTISAGCIGPACARCRAKSDDSPSSAGLVECKASEDAGELLAAFYRFSTDRCVDVPFHVEAAAGHSQWAWPLQFHPAAIAVCAGIRRSGADKGS